MPKKVLDLTDPAVRQKLGVTAEQLTAESNTPGAYILTQQIGDLARKYGFDAVKVPSAAMKQINQSGTNIVRLVP